MQSEICIIKNNVMNKQLCRYTNTYIQRKKKKTEISFALWNKWEEFAFICQSNVCMYINEEIFKLYVCVHVCTCVGHQKQLKLKHLVWHFRFLTCCISFTNNV